ncbi:MAG TPA: hypothetical protein VMJ10_02515 [Kofleriaceae bacterium]|nr:hypothetical protein [Kofleriaceae bacterium]
MTARHAWIDGARVALDPGALLGQGGEAEVYDLRDGRVVKWWKPPEHPDFDGLPAAQAAAARRIAAAPARLRTLPGKLPAAVVVPSGLALADKRGTRVVGYVMAKVAGEPLHAFGEPRWRRDHAPAGDDVVAALLALHDAIAALHRAGVVIGDCNDLNVLVDARRVWLIDVDSYQLPGFPCEMFSERFVDPRLCTPQQLVPVRPHDTDSDWFAFAAMVVRTLLCVGPWAGVCKQTPLPARALRRRSVLGDGIVYPRAARPIATLPDELVETLRAIFERDVRGTFPRAVLERLHLRRCSACGEEHARHRCPSCQQRAPLPAAVVHGRLAWQPIALADVAAGSCEVGRVPRFGVWRDGDALMRQARLAPERIGSVLAGETRAWVGSRFGAGFYRAGGYTVGFVFRPDRGPLDDRVALPRIRGRLVDAHAIVGDDRAWLVLRAAETTTIVVIDGDARVLACETVADAPWLAGLAGACAAGAHLFVPTDDGVARIEVVQGTIAQTRVFAETAPLVGAGDRLALHPNGLDVIRARDAIRMALN